MQEFCIPQKDETNSDITIKDLIEYVAFPLQDYLSLRDKQFSNDLPIHLKACRKKLRMYGTDEDLMENLRKFKDFPECYRFFNDSPMNRTPKVFESLKGEKFIHRIDLYPILENITVNTIMLPSPVFAKIINHYIQRYYPKHHTSVQFVKFQPEMFEEYKKEIWKAYLTAFEDHVKVEEQIVEFIQKGEYRKVDKIFAEIDPVGYNEDDSRYYINSNRSMPPILKKEMRDAAVIYVQTHIKKALGILMRGRNEFHFFQPFIDPMIAPPTVRLFEDKDERFVIKSEFFDSINLLLPLIDRILFEEDRDVGIISTISLTDIMEFYGDHAKKIEFIRYPITRPKHKGAFVQGRNRRTFCVLIADAFLECMKFLISYCQIFQKIKDFNVIQIVFDEMEKVFHADFDSPCFFDLQFFKVMKNNVFAGMRIFDATPVREIRDVPPDGFSLRMLQNELQYLGLLKLFPNIEEHAKRVFPEIQKRKNGEFLRTCDLFEAIEHCQLIGFLEKFPIFAVFMHSQKACHMIMGLQCVECNENWHDEFEIEQFNEKNVISFGKIKIQEEKDERECEII
ncbi:hypothetical protein B9Z55_004350 [Caenorhabditis nigoni]|uniref:DUF7809 domain-containing protein n=1 Tax=Caenorhabditis nigoni TaxID=1611254 RepID=A0A2G5UW38_9PELO|nr:hypothetical protein B9Z55_004350 [Caenorhabditis nigoni]